MPPSPSDDSFAKAPPALPDFYGAVTTEPFPVPAVPPGVVDPRLWRQFVANPFPQDAPGTVVVDPGAGYLFLVGDDGRALRYGAGTGAGSNACPQDWGLKGKVAKDGSFTCTPKAKGAKKPEKELACPAGTSYFYGAKALGCEKAQ